MTDNQKKFLVEFAALLRKYGTNELKGHNGLPVPMDFVSNGEKLRILNYQDGVFDVESRSSYMIAL